MPSAVRIKTTAGWQDLAVQGPGGAMQLISDMPLSAAASSIDFPNIPQTFAHLVLKVTVRGTGTGSTLLVACFNGDFGLNYDWQRMGFVSTGVTASQFLGAGGINFQSIPNANNTANRFAAAVIEVPNYTGTQHKTAQGTTVNPYAAGGAVAGTTAMGVWNNGAAINRITLLPFDANFAAGSRATLYGLGGPGSGLTGPSLVTSLPASPTDGQEVYYQNAVMEVARIIWHLRYRSASASSYKWEFLGGLPLLSDVDTDETIINPAGFAELATTQSIIVPLAGVYDADIRASAYGPTVGHQAAIAVGGSLLCRQDTHLSGANHRTTLSERRQVSPDCTAGLDLRMLFYGSTTAIHFAGRRFSLLPRRVG